MSGVKLRVVISLANDRRISHKKCLNLNGSILVMEVNLSIKVPGGEVCASTHKAKSKNFISNGVSVRFIAEILI